MGTKQFPSRHLYLYAKGAYKRSDDSLMDDLREIVANICLLPVGLVTEEDVYRVCIDVVMEYIFVGLEKDMQRKAVLSLLMNIGAFKVVRGEKYQVERSPRVAILQECLSILATSSVRSSNGLINIDLGQPDPTVLPLATDHQYGQIHEVVLKSDF